MKVLVAAVLISLSLQAQTIVGASYTAPAPVSAAPGQLLTLIVSGLNIAQGVRAPGGALPTTLGGITVTLHQSTDRAVPILEIHPVSTCPGFQQLAMTPGCAMLDAITVQIPYELFVPCPLCLTAVPLIPGELYVTANGQTGAVIELTPVGDQVHVLTSCDVMMTPITAPPPAAAAGSRSCAPMVTHADGTMVTVSKPADVGEELTAWVVGLGATNPASSTGQPASSAAPTVTTFYLDYNYTVNALPVRPFTGRPDVKPPQPLFVGIVPGFVGLYQINFIVPPQPPNGTPRCVLTASFAAGGNVPYSNLTVSIGGQSSFDGAGICVNTQIPID